MIERSSHVMIGMRLCDAFRAGNPSVDEVRAMAGCSRAQAYRHIAAWRAYVEQGAIRRPARRVVGRRVGAA